MSDEIKQLVVASKVKEIIKEKGLQTSSEALEELNKHVHGILDRAADRAGLNKRSTIKKQDI